MSLERCEKVGSGSYGVVYAAKQIILSPNQDIVPIQDVTRADLRFTEVSSIVDHVSETLRNVSNERMVAVKRNFKEPTVDWMGNLRELDIMGMLTNHPHIINLLNVVFEDPFSNVPMTPVVDTSFSAHKEDKLHFIVDYAKYDLETYLDKDNVSFEQLKIFMLQLLLGLEYMHSQCVVHRDLKPSNILIDEKGEDRNLKICDFGMSQVLRGAVCTPGVTTSWYRAPEVCMQFKRYTDKIDIWSAGCIMYQMISRRSLIYQEDDNLKILSDILGVLPIAVSSETLARMRNEPHWPDAGMPTTRTIWNRKTLVGRMELYDSDKREFNSTYGSLAQFEDLLTKLLAFDPKERYSATQALAHPFFAHYAARVDEVRNSRPPQPSMLPYFRIYPCKERSWVMQIAISLFNQNMDYDHPDNSIPKVSLKSSDEAVVSPSFGFLQNPTNLLRLSGSLKINRDRTRVRPASYDWYSHRVLFHSLDLYDRYLEYQARERNLEDLRNVDLGIDQARAILEFYVCLYTIHKYYCALKIPKDWCEFAPNKVFEDAKDGAGEDFERFIVEKVCVFKLFRETLIEMPSHYNEPCNDQVAAKLLQRYAEVSTPYVQGSVRNLYRKFAHEQTSVSSPQMPHHSQILYRIPYEARSSAN